jgi:hypothetical protein
MTVWLKWVGTEKVFPLVPGQSVVIGRGHYADIDTDNVHFSRRHLEVLWDGCRVRVRDLHSSCGTYINCKYGLGIYVTEPGGNILRLGDIVRVGPVRFLLGASTQMEPSRLAWHDGLLVSMARHIYESCDFIDMPILADALEEAGCTDQEILAHCRSGGEHRRGCWVVDLVLGKE